MNDGLAVLQTSVDRLHGLVAPLNDAALERNAYPSEWTIVEVLSHLGSGAVLMHRRLDDALARHVTPDDFAPSVWSVWNAKSPCAQADDALAADRALLDRVLQLDDSERARLRYSIGPLDLDFDGMVVLRLNEHALHTWDVEVALDAGATVSPDSVAIVVDNLELIGRFTARPTGATRTFVIATTDPDRRFTVELTPDSVSFTRSATAGDADLTLPAEQWVRLVYGRLDGPSSAIADELRGVFPGP